VQHGRVWWALDGVRAELGAGVSTDQELDEAGLPHAQAGVTMNHTVTGAPRHGADAKLLFNLQYGVAADAHHATCYNDQCSSTAVGDGTQRLCCRCLASADLQHAVHTREGACCGVF
jgi:hypothetical protein